MSTATVPSTVTGTYAIDPTHSRIGFVARPAMVTKVRGSFNEFAGAGSFDAEDPTNSRLQLTIQAASIDTRNADRDGHLKSNDFFDMETYPTITFTSTAVEQVDPESYRVTGDLTIKGVTKPVTFEFDFGGFGQDPYGNYKAGATAKTKINREDFGLTYNAALETGGMLLGDEVTITLELQAVLAS
jgi:polyisoprenoid-binding protein YceI